MVSSPDRVRDKDDAKESPNNSVMLQRPSSVPKKKWDDLKNAIRALSGLYASTAGEFQTEFVRCGSAQIRRIVHIRVTHGILPTRNTFGQRSSTVAMFPLAFATPLTT